LRKIASEVGVKNIYHKDESSRFGLGSFKALGGTYGVLKFIHHALESELGEEVSIEDIHRGNYSKYISKYTVTTATDGNHGRSVAFGAKLFGCKCQIYIHSEVSSGREKAMEKLEATVTRISGNYDKSLKVFIEDANKND
jgi:diaminopropionate ammonia-lyase